MFVAWNILHVDAILETKFVDVVPANLNVFGVSGVARIDDDKSRLVVAVCDDGDVVHFKIREQLCNPDNFFDAFR